MQETRKASFLLLCKDNIAIPPKESHHKDEKYPGAYVKDPLVGMHKWIVSFDINSLYPHLIMQYNISPEKIIGMKSEGISVNTEFKIGAVSVERIMKSIENYISKMILNY